MSNESQSVTPQRDEVRLYRPSNGEEGRAFQDHFCLRCKHDAKFRRTQDGGDGCQIILLAMVYNKTEEHYPREWRYDFEGRPVCTKFKDIDDGGDKPEPPPIDPLQIVLIADPSEDIAGISPSQPTEKAIPSSVVPSVVGDAE